MKRVFHNIRVLIRRYKRKKINQYKFRYICIISFLAFILLGAFIGFKNTLAKYESSTKISPNIDTAFYVINPGTYKKNMNINNLVPSDAPYVYSFTVSNYNDKKESDVDMVYTVELITTTNLPLEYQIFYNEDYTTGSDILINKETKKDSDNTWYNYFSNNTKYSFTHNVKTVDTFTIAVMFPSSYKIDTEYTEKIENIDIIIKSKQVIEGE